MTNGVHHVIAKAHRRLVSANSNFIFATVYSLVGDVNGDGVVDTADRDELERFIGINSSHPAYQPWYDTDGDGVVTEADLAQIGYSFGNMVTP